MKNNLIGTKDLLAHLDTLKSVVQDFAAREEKLNATFRDQSGKERNAFDTRENQLTAASSERLAAQVDALAEAKAQLQNRTARRKARITRAHNFISERTQTSFSAQDEDCKRAAQQGLIEAERRYHADLAQAAANFETFRQRQAEAAQALAQLEHAVRSAFGGSGKFRRMLAAPARPENTFTGDGNDVLDELQRVSAKIDTDLGRFKKAPLPQLFRFIPIWLAVVLLAGVAAANPVLAHFGKHIITQLHAMIALAALAVVVAAYWLGIRSAAPLAKTIAGDFTRAHWLLDFSWDQAVAFHQAEQQRIETGFQETKNAVNQEWKRTTRELVELRNRRPTELEDRVAALYQRNEQFYQAEWQRIQQSHEETMSQLREAAGRQKIQLGETHQANLKRLEDEFHLAWQKLETEWRERVLPLCETLQSTQAAAEKSFPSWPAFANAAWQAPETFINAVPFASLAVELKKFIGALPKDKRLALPGAASLSLPLLLTHPQQGSLLFETGKDGGGEAVSAINNIILRLLATTPPGRLEFTIFDPVGLGQNFASLMHLADYESSTINSRIWTQSAQFEEKLAELNEHMEKIIQMYLRNEYATITEYNAEAGSVAEKYQFLVIASFPVNFSDTAAKRLRNIAANGARCGVFTLIQWDQRNALPQDFVPDELRSHSVCLTRTEKGFEFPNWRAAGTQVRLDEPPPTEFTTQLLHQIGKLGINANRVEVPFEHVAPAETEVWTGETSEELRVPIGRSGATKLQYLAIGRDTRQHALIAGKTGSGKSTLFHVVITNLALRCSPEQVEFYLVDFKKGVEFKCYGNYRLPHARVVAIESDRAFGLSVLQRVDDELRRRGDLFRKVGAQNLAGYRSGGGPEPMPRVLLMIDEFQEFFTEEDRVSQNAAVLLDRIVRQGRAFGIHVILGSQTLGGAYTLARATIGQMVIRIALQCNEADAYLIMDQDNPAPRLLSRPGEGIYNDTAGSIEGNSPFQAVWLSDKTREEYLAKVRTHADQTGREYAGPMVFEGNAPADVRENLVLAGFLKAWKNLLLSAPSGKVEVRENLAVTETDGALTPHPGPLPVEGRGEKTPAQASVWLGAPNSIKGPTEAVFRRQSASNLLVVGQSDERTLTVLAIGLISLAAQHTKENAQFFCLHNLAAGSSQLEFCQRVTQSIPQPLTQTGNANLAEVMNTLAAELKRRTEGGAAGPEIYLLVHDLQNFKKLRQEDEFSFSSASSEATPAATLLELITNGPAQGMHVILTCDSYGNVTRFLGRKALAEIELRVAFQMSAGDSASLIDAPDASTLGMHRAVLFNEREGSLETFRPYALPGNDWLDTAARQLATK